MICHDKSSVMSATVLMDGSCTMPIWSLTSASGLGPQKTPQVGRDLGQDTGLENWTGLKQDGIAGFDKMICRLVNRKSGVHVCAFESFLFGW